VGRWTTWFIGVPVSGARWCEVISFSISLSKAGCLDFFSGCRIKIDVPRDFVRETVAKPESERAKYFKEYLCAYQERPGLKRSGRFSV